MAQKINGFTQTPHVFQVFSYFVYLTITFFDLVIFIPLLGSNILIYVIYGILTAVAILSTITCTMVDTTDKFALMQLEMRKKNQIFNFLNYNLDMYCEFCDLYVQHNTKHCKRCNRCAEEFDHHCKWINNCVGASNYKSFITMIVSVWAQFVMSIVLHGVVIHNIDNLDDDHYVINFAKDDVHVKYIICIILLVPTCIIVLGLTHLIGFHIYLIKNNLTTYNFIVDRMNRKHIEQQNTKVAPQPPLFAEISLQPNVPTQQQINNQHGSHDNPQSYSFEQQNLSQKQMMYISSRKQSHYSLGCMTNLEKEDDEKSVQFQEEQQKNNNNLGGGITLEVMHLNDYDSVDGDGKNLQVYTYQ